jgi:hypothetical protein
LEPRLFVAIDTFELHRPDWRGRRPYAERIGTGTHEEFYREMFAREIEAGQVAIHPGFSHDVLSGFPDRHFDMIYIDAGHDYESVRRDLEVARHKIKDDGFLVLNDYTIGSMLLSLPFGVVHAVNEFCVEQGWEIRYLALHPLMFCDVALARIRD